MDNPKEQKFSNSHTQRQDVSTEKKMCNGKKTSWQPSLANEIHKKVVVIQYTSKPFYYIDLLVF